MKISKMIIILNNFINVWELEQADEDMQMTIYKGDIETFKEVVDILEKQITNRWISVHEELPQKCGTYLVAWRPTWLDAELGHYYEMLEFDPDDESGWVSSIEQCEEYVLLAWRELPEPYVD